jgi:uncharacterized protein YkwD
LIARILFVTLLACVTSFCVAKGVPAFYPDFLSLSAPLYAEVPDLQNCQTGQLHEAESQHVLATVNAIRELHSLAPVALDKQAEHAATQAALMFAANAQIAHNPPEAWRCYSAEGAKAAAKSIISGGVSAKNIAFHRPEQDIIAWLTDVNSMVPEAIGHRRLLLDPFLKKIAYGRVSGRIDRDHISVGSALTLIANNNSALVSTAPEIIAYPYHDYPARYSADATVLSLSLLIDKIYISGNALVDFSNVRISVITEKGKIIQARNIRFDNQYYGLPNNLQFSLARIEPGLRYEVRIDDVRIDGVVKSYTYWFRIMPDSSLNSLILQ